jgi:hypothetical protein
MRPKSGHKKKKPITSRNPKSVTQIQKQGSPANASISTLRGQSSTRSHTALTTVATADAPAVNHSPTATDAMTHSLQAKDACRISIKIPPWLHRFATIWTKILSAILSTISLNILSVALGLNSLGPVPLLNIVRAHQTISILISCLILAVSVLSWLIARVPLPEKKADTTLLLTHGLAISAFLTTTNTVICCAVLATILLKPAWCPDFLCPAPEPILAATGTHDTELEAYFTAIQSPFIVLPNSPSHSIGALRIDRKNSQDYRVAFGVHNLLQHTPYPIVIENVSLIVVQTPPTPYPLRVQYIPPMRVYNSNIYQVAYRGQSAGGILTANYVAVPNANVQLEQGEADEIDLDVTSKLAIDLQFKIQITYHLSTDPTYHTLTIPGTYEVIFSDATNWQQYQLEKGHFIPSNNS